MASLSKREQARNERELQDLIRQPGNSTCADCGARNPAWASWNLGIFLCMRCASIHRKLGTHISKVKSLSMDKWTADQVETMKLQGNATSNKHYNPKNKRPDIPLDADEVDSAMERYIRKKYQEKSLVDGRPEPPSRADRPDRLDRPDANDLSSMAPVSQSLSGGELPPTAKKHKFFGFSLRTSSKKDRAGVNDAFKITPVEYSPTSGVTREVPDHELQAKLAQLRDMGFSDNDKNHSVLKRSGGDLERTVATLIKLGSTEPPRRHRSPPPKIETASSASAPPTASLSNNPFEQIKRDEAQQSDFGLSFDAPAPKQSLSAQPSGNPWQSAISTPQTTGIEQQFAGLQVSNPLFPHNTGGYATQSSYQQNPHQQAMAPPMPQQPQQYGYTASPTTTSNPFYQAPLSSQSTGNNHDLQQQYTQPVSSPQNNPFMITQQPPMQMSSGNPFGLPPSQSPPQAQQHWSSPQSQNTNPFGYTQAQVSPSIQQSQQTQNFPLTAQQTQFSPFGQAQSSQSQITNYNYGQPQQGHSSQQFLQPQQPSFTQVPQQSQPQQQYTQQNQLAFQYHQQQQQPQPLSPQQTGRYTKNDIMALFSQPMQPPPQQLAPITEDSQTQVQQQSQTSNQTYQHQNQQPISLAPTNNPYGAPSPASAKRSVTLPANMHSSSSSPYTTNNRNPFLTSGATSRNPSGNSVSSTPGQAPGQWPGQLQPQQQVLSLSMAYGTSGGRHASNESVSVNNPALMDGRHSPDAFAGLSARY